MTWCLAVCVLSLIYVTLFLCETAVICLVTPTGVILLDASTNP